MFANTFHIRIRDRIGLSFGLFPSGAVTVVFVSFRRRCYRRPVLDRSRPVLPGKAGSAGAPRHLCSAAGCRCGPRRRSLTIFTKYSALFSVYNAIIHSESYPKVKPRNNQKTCPTLTVLSIVITQASIQCISIKRPDISARLQDFHSERFETQGIAVAPGNFGCLLQTL